MEELVRLGLPLYGDEPLSTTEIETLLATDATAANRTQQEWNRDLNNAVEHDELESAIRQQADARREEIQGERRQMREKLQEAGYGQSMVGIDNLSVASEDLLTIGLYYPA
jgi:hypothetical protein